MCKAITSVIIKVHLQIYYILITNEEPICTEVILYLLTLYCLHDILLIINCIFTDNSIFTLYYCICMINTFVISVLFSIVYDCNYLIIIL